MTSHGALIPLAENHLACSGLQHRGYGDVDRLANHLARIIDDHHGSVVEIGDALVVLFAFLQNKYPHDFAGQDDRLERVGQFIDIEHSHPLQLGHLIQIEVVGQNLAFVDFGQLDRLHVDFADARKVIFHNLNLDRGSFLQPLQDVEAAASAIAFQRVGGVSYQLQFPQHELRNHNETVEESSLGDIGNAPVNDDARIENLVTLLARFLSAKDAAESREV